MNQHWLAVGFCISAAFAALMGFAIQRGATCTVAAVDEIITKRRATRLAAIIEASVWVVAGLLIARALGFAWFMPDGYGIGTATLAGGALLGFGAYVSRACVFGAIARLGSGEWAYAVTPVGFFVGCATVGLFPIARPDPALHMSPILQAPIWIAALAVAFVVIRLACMLIVARRSRAQRGTSGETSAWSPHTATTVIGIAFVVILLISGAWAYTDVLAELAHGMASSLPARIGLLVALLTGAIVGGVSAGRWSNARVSLGAISRCFFGGWLMGWGSLLIPGSNDGLILVGMPVLLPHAWVAFATMCAVIAASMLVVRMLGSSANAPTHVAHSSTAK